MSNTWQTTESGQVGRRLLRKMDSGVLSTMSIEMPGFPFGSLTPFVTTHDGKAVIYVSGIAQHTKNIQQDDKVCLTVIDDGGGNKQDQGRATVLGHAKVVPEASLTAVSERYYAFFPRARSYGEAHDFQFLWIEPLRVRYIGGFGKIFWIEQEEWAVPNPEWAAQEGGIIEHMNDDHRDALNAMAKHFANVDCTETKLIASDAEGCHIKTNAGIHYVPYESCALGQDDIRQEMIALAKASRS